MMAFAQEREYDGQDGMAQVKDYQRIPTPDMTAIQQVRYIEVLQRVRDGWEWSPFMPQLEGSATTPATSRCRVPMPVQAATRDDPMWIARIVYTSTEKEMLSAEFVVVFEHPRGTTFYLDEAFWRIMSVAGLDPAEWIMKNQSNDFGGVPYRGDLWIRTYELDSNNFAP